MKFVFCATVLFCFSAHVFGQVKTSSLLTDSISLGKEGRIIVLVETDTLKIISTYERFTENCKRWILKHDIEWDKNLLALFHDNCSNPIIVKNIALTKLQQSRLNFRISDLLEEGACLVIYKPTKQAINNVIIEKYMTKYIYGRKIKMDDNYIILNIVDGVF